uniref:Uncharacterized protein n=1 Tax=Lygus hesperus TaxID=30085 RepID=A0A146M0B4_LYGHE
MKVLDVFPLYMPEQHAFKAGPKVGCATSKNLFLPARHLVRDVEIAFAGQRGCGKTRVMHALRRVTKSIHAQQTHESPNPSETRRVNMIEFFACRRPTLDSQSEVYQKIAEACPPPRRIHDRVPEATMDEALQRSMNLM